MSSSTLLSRTLPRVIRGVRSSTTASRSSLANNNNNNKKTPVSLNHQVVTKRRMGAGGGQPVPQSMEAELFQGHPKDPEGWETTIYATYGISAVLLTLALGFAPETTIQAWAEGEARARLDLKASGKVTEFEFGTHYDTVGYRYQYESLSPDDPFDEELEEEEDEDEEEEEEEDEEEGGEEDEDEDD